MELGIKEIEEIEQFKADIKNVVNNIKDRDTPIRLENCYSADLVTTIMAIEVYHNIHVIIPTVTLDDKRMLYVSNTARYWDILKLCDALDDQVFLGYNDSYFNN